MIKCIVTGRRLRVSEKDSAGEFYPIYVVLKNFNIETSSKSEKVKARVEMGDLTEIIIDCPNPCHMIKYLQMLDVITYAPHKVDKITDLDEIFAWEGSHKND